MLQVFEKFVMEVDLFRSNVLGLWFGNCFCWWLHGCLLCFFSSYCICLKYDTMRDLTVYSHVFFLFFCLKELAEQLKAQLEKANKFKETISSKKSGIEVSINS